MLLWLLQTSHVTMVTQSIHASLGDVGRVVDVEGSWWRSGGMVDVEEGWMLRENVCGGRLVDVEEVWMWR